MGYTEKLSDRQIALIQGSAFILTEHLNFSKEEAFKIISESLREELEASKVTFEFLEIGTIAYRQDFARKLVRRVERKSYEIRKVSPEQMKRS
ncbi:MAG TPA: hypothetical protein PKD50_17110, partial [Leptospiraceae bacterium]|nr:hypothetical protein [Leptospiraceae bacterium]